MSNSDSNHRQETFDQILLMLDPAIRRACMHYSHHSEREEVARLKSRLVLHLLEDDYRRLSSYREEAELETWLQKVVNHFVYDFLKAERRNVSLEELVEDALLITPNQEVFLLLNEQYAALERAFNRLTEREQVLFVLICQEVSPKEIAQQLRVGEPTVYTYKHSLIKKLQRLIQSEFEADE